MLAANIWLKLGGPGNWPSVGLFAFIGHRKWPINRPIIKWVIKSGTYLLGNVWLRLEGSENRPLMMGGDLSQTCVAVRIGPGLAPTLPCNDSSTKLALRHLPYLCLLVA